MYVLRIADFMSLEKLEPHQTLLAKGVLVEWVPEMEGKVIFVSHEWLSYTHADPDGVQLRSLQSVLGRLMRGEIARVAPYWAYQMVLGKRMVVKADAWKASLPDMFIWLDYASIPQVGARGTKTDTADMAKEDLQRMDVDLAKTVQDLQDAVNSIPGYVQRAAMIIINAPVCHHTDTNRVCNFSTWTSRGWCRLEYVAASLSPNPVQIIVSEGPMHTPYFMLLGEVNFRLAGEGNFTCCRLGHIVNGRVIECDKLKVGGVLTTLLDNLEHHLIEKDIETMRVYVCMRHRVLSGLPVLGDSPPRGLHTLKEKLRWRDEDSLRAKETGRTLLMHAVAANDAAAVRELLECTTTTSSEINMPLQKSFAVFYHVNLTPLHLAMSYADFEVVEMLLDAKADPTARVKGRANRGYDGLFYAAIFCRIGHIVGPRFPSWDLPVGRGLLASRRGTSRVANLSLDSCP